MNLGSIFTSENYSAFLSGGNRLRRQVILIGNSERLILPVTPQKYSVTTSQDNKTFDILDSGETLIFGNEKLSKLKFSSFFPAPFHRYPFVVGTIIEPSDAVALILKWKTDKLPVQVIITDSPVNDNFAIMEFNYNEKDGSRDIYFDLSLTAYRDWNLARANNQDKTPDSITGLRSRSDSDTNITQRLKYAGDWYEYSRISGAAMPSNYSANTFNSIFGV